MEKTNNILLIVGLYVNIITVYRFIITFYRLFG